MTEWADLGEVDQILKESLVEKQTQRPGKEMLSVQSHTGVKNRGSPGRLIPS